MFKYDTKIAPELLPNVSKFAEYLSNTQWKELKQKNPNLRVFGTQQFDKEGTFIELPSKDSFSDTKLRILRTIQKIAEMRDVDELEILHEVFQYNCDVLRQRIIIQGAEKNITNIPLITLQEYLTNILGVIENASYFETVIEKDHNYNSYKFSKTKNKTEKIKEITEKLRFGHTFTGSFGLSIEMPISDTKEIFNDNSNNLFPYMAPPPPPPTLERRAMERIAIGFDDIANTDSTNQNTTEIVNNYKNGFNINMCNSLCSALESLKKIENSELEFSFKWSPIIVPSSKILSLKSTILSPEKTIPVIHSAVKKMEEINKKNPIRIFGEIITLNDDSETKESDQNKKRTIIIKCKSNNDVGKVKMTLTEKDYDKAIDIHKLKKWISVIGIIDLENNIRRLYNPQKIKEVEPQNSLFHKESIEDAS
jgi:hypothetical protein